MTERTRREYLRDFGIAAGGISIAGCLGGGEEGESTPDSTPTEKSSDSTPEQTDTTEDRTETEEQTTTEGSAPKSQILGVVPSSSQLSNLGGGSSHPVTYFDHGYPATIGAQMSDETVSSYEQEGKIVPQWADFGIGDVQEKTAATILGAGVGAYRLGDSSGSLSEDVEEVGEIEGRTLYEWEDEQGNVRSILGGEDVIFDASGSATQHDALRTLLEMTVKAHNGKIETYQETDSLGQVLSEVPYEHLISTQPTPDGQNVAEGYRMTVEGETYMLEDISIDESGNLGVESSENKPIKELGYRTGWWV